MNNIRSSIIASLYFLLIFTTTVNAAQTHEITVNEKGLSISPTAMVSIGDTLKFINTGSKQHQIQSVSGLFFDTGLLNPGVSFEYIIPSQGSFINAGTANNSTFFDAEMPENQLTLRVLNEPVILFPRDSWFLKKYPINILILFGDMTPGFTPVLPPPRVQNVQLLVDGTQIFTGSFFEFISSNFVTIEQTQGLSDGQGYNAFTITVDAKTLSIGAHTLTVKVTLANGSQYEDTVRYTILQPGFNIVISGT